MSTPVDAAGRDRLLRLATAVVAFEVTLGLLTEVDFRKAGLLWINLYWLVSAGGAWALSLHRFPSRRGTKRTVRIAFSACLGTYFMGQMVWGLQVMLDWTVVPGPSDVLFLFAPLPAIWGALVAIRRRTSVASLMTARLDALTVMLAIVVGTLAVFGTNNQGLETTIMLLYPILYLSPAGAILVTVLAVSERPRLEGVWMVLLGASVLGGSFVVWTARAIAGAQPVGTTVDYLFGIGLLLAGFGTATWTSETVTDDDQSRWLRNLSDVLPLVAIVVAASVAFHSESLHDMMMLTWLALVAMLIVNGIRQILLIRSQRLNLQSLRTLAAELANAEERERRKIATYLHDHVSQAIAVLSLKFGLLRSVVGPAEAAKLHDEIEELLSKTADDAQSTTFDLSPPVLYELGLEAAVEHLASELNQKYSLGIAVFNDGPDEPFTHDVAPLLYRFVRELLMNAMKHAKAAKISVRIIRKERAATIIVEDDGCGFDATALVPASESGFGLYSIRERSRAIGGQFEIRSESGVGTRARIIVPI